MSWCSLSLSLSSCWPSLVEFPTCSIIFKIRRGRTLQRAQVLMEYLLISSGFYCRYYHPTIITTNIPCKNILQVKRIILSLLLHCFWFPCTHPFLMKMTAIFKPHCRNAPNDPLIAKNLSNSRFCELREHLISTQHSFGDWTSWHNIYVKFLFSHSEVIPIMIR